MNAQFISLSNYVNAKYTTLSNNLDTKLDKTGGTISGDININLNKITSSFTPVLENDLVNKKYIDSLTSVTLDTISVNSKLNKTGARAICPPPTRSRRFDSC